MPPITGNINYPYNAIELTGEVNRVPNVWGDLQAEKLFGSEYPTTTMVEIQFQDGVVTVLEADERGSPGVESTIETQNGVILKIPHIPHMGRIKPEDLQDRWVFESGQRRLMTVADATSKKLLQLRRNHAQTLELLRWGALKGQLVTGLGKVLYDFFEVFKVTKKTFDLKLDDDTTDVLAICDQIRQYMETHLLGEMMNGVRCKVAPDLFRKLVTHPNVEKFFIQWQGAQALLAASEKRDFTFGGITWEQNFHTVSNLKGQPVKFIANGKGIAYPAGTADTFKTFFGPAHHIAMVNTAGAEVFVSPEVLKHGQGVELLSQSNPLPVCQRPELLVEVFSN